MADFSLQDLWWLKPAQQDNPMPALQLGVSIAQNKAKMDLAERDLANDIARTSLMREEMLAKQKIQTMLVAGNAEMASAISEITDWTDDEQVSKVWAVGARNPMTVGSKAWLGAQHMHESARTAKRLEEEARSRIEERVDRTEVNRAKLRLQELLADHTIPLTDARVVQAQQEAALAERRTLVQEGNLDLRGREIAGKETRLGLRERYLNERNSLDREEKDILSTTFDATEKARLRKMYNLKRREITKKFYGPDTAKAQPEVPTPATTAHDPRVPRAGLQTNEPPVVAPQVIAPSGKVRVISPDGTPGFIPESQLEEALKAGYTKP